MAGEQAWVGELDGIERRFRETADELQRLRGRLCHVARERGVDAIREEWDEVDRRWFVGVGALLVGFFLASYLFYMNLGWYADQRVLPASSDWLLDQLPTVQLIPMLSWGWLGLHVFAIGAAVLYQPRRMPFLLFLMGVYLFVRTLYVFLSPVGAPLAILDMRELDALFAQVAGEYTFQNEFIFSGHTAIPFLFALFLERRWHKAVMLLGSLAMAASVLLTHNHYSVDVLSAYFMGFAIYTLSERAYARLVRPLYLARDRSGPAPSAA